MSSGAMPSLPDNRGEERVVGTSDTAGSTALRTPAEDVQWCTRDEPFVASDGRVSWRSRGDGCA
jgi:hypothetical protein